MIPKALNDASEIDALAPRIKWHLAEFAASGAMSPQDFIDDIKSKHRQLWYIEDGDNIPCVLLTTISPDRMKTCTITHCAGHDYTKWVDMWYVVESWAIDNGCKRIEAITRAGWTRPLKEFGLKQTHVILEKRL